jgi:hypothetical protein
MIGCSQCGKTFDPQGSKASISGSVMGDEYIETFFFCDLCQVYTVEIIHDQFVREDYVIIKGPVPKAEGDARVALIRQCPEPWDKKCRCKAHITYFDGALD